MTNICKHPIQCSLVTSQTLSTCNYLTDLKSTFKTDCKYTKWSASVNTMPGATYCSNIFTHVECLPPEVDIVVIRYFCVKAKPVITWVSWVASTVCTMTENDNTLWEIKCTANCTINNLCANRKKAFAFQLVELFIISPYYLYLIIFVLQN